ncbi:hypothetical protein BDR05DRAFT_1006190 [Suillus weaverae]|nr:hypothetical protein BDR05DRAFT_1006190 [Suillus weaverae]
MSLTSREALQYLRDVQKNDSAGWARIATAQYKTDSVDWATDSASEDEATNAIGVESPFDDAGEHDLDASDVPMDALLDHMASGGEHICSDCRINADGGLSCANRSEVYDIAAEDVEGGSNSVQKVEYGRGKRRHIANMIVIGVTGVGKSTFINAAIGQVVTPIGHDLESCTARIQHACCACPGDPSRRIVLVDTPGFDNPFEHDSEILRRIAVWMASSYSDNMKLTGVIYLHDICDPRLHMSLDVFRRLHGGNAENHAILATTKWGQVATDVGERRERLLKSLFKQEMVTHESEVARFLGSHTSAWDVMKPILANKAAVDIQEGLVGSDRMIPEIDAGNALPAALIDLEESYKRAIDGLKGKVRDDEQQKRLKESEEELRALLKQIQESRNPHTVRGFLASLFETLRSMTLERETNASLTPDAEQRVRKAQGDLALKWRDFDTAIDRYTATIKLERSDYTAVRLAPFLPLGYYRKHRALHGAGRYCEAICAFDKFLDLNGTAASGTISQYVRPETVKLTIGEIANRILNNTPPRLFDTETGVICDQPARLEIFEHSRYFMETVSMITTYDELEKEAELKVHEYFAYGMLSHRWESGEIRLQDIRQGESIYKQTSRFAGLSKLRNFCRIIKDNQLRWAWCDTCCIDLTNSVELQEAITSMFRWYRGSALTIIYLSDVFNSALGALMKSLWLTRGWTLQELLAPRVILFYRRDWTVYASEESLKNGEVVPNHKNSDNICRVLEKATGIDVLNLRNFEPGTGYSRLKLQWASRRSTTKVEDIAYSLFGIFDVQLPILYGEREDKALGRLIQEIVCKTGDVSVLDWVGKPGRMNSSLPENILCFQAAKWRPKPLAVKDSMSILRESLSFDALTTIAMLRHRLQDLPSPLLMYGKLTIPSIIYRVKDISEQRTSHNNLRHYSLDVAGLKELHINTTENLTTGLQMSPSRCDYSIAHIWRDDLLQRLTEEPDDETTCTLEFISSLGQPFLAFLLVREGRNTFRKVASTERIIAQIDDVSKVHTASFDVKTVEIV